MIIHQLVPGFGPAIRSPTQRWTWPGSSAAQGTTASSTPRPPLRRGTRSCDRCPSCVPPPTSSSCCIIRAPRRSSRAGSCCRGARGWSSTTVRRRTPWRASAPGPQPSSRAWVPSARCRSPPPASAPGSCAPQAIATCTCCRPSWRSHASTWALSIAGWAQRARGPSSWPVVLRTRPVRGWRTSWRLHRARLSLRADARLALLLDSGTDSAGIHGRATRRLLRSCSALPGVRVLQSPTHEERVATAAREQCLRVHGRAGHDRTEVSSRPWLPECRCWPSPLPVCPSSSRERASPSVTRTSPSSPSCWSCSTRTPRCAVACCGDRAGVWRRSGPGVRSACLPTSWRRCFPRMRGRVLPTAQAR